MRHAGRSLTEPPGLKPSSLAKILTPLGKPADPLNFQERGVADQIEGRFDLNWRAGIRWNQAQVGRGLSHRRYQSSID